MDPLRSTKSFLKVRFARVICLMGIHNVGDRSNKSSYRGRYAIGLNLQVIPGTLLRRKNVANRKKRTKLSRMHIGKGIFLIWSMLMDCSNYISP